MNLLDLIFPKFCVGCNKFGQYFCQNCLASIRYISDPVCPLCGKPAIGGMTHSRCRTGLSIDGVYAMAHFNGPLRQAIHQLKYKFVYDLVESLGSLLFFRYPKTLPTFDLICPVPLHAAKENSRGFNQSHLLAASLGEKLKVPVIKYMLHRTRNTRAQAELEGTARRANIKNAFEYKGKASLEGKTIAIIDDVATTFSTLNECAKVLKRQRAKCVWGIALAHG